MKKKLFLSIIPLCLTLGACSSPVKDSDKTPLFETAKEDTEGYDDLFINADIKYLDPTPVFNEEPRIGIQSIAGDGVTSIRFVGAVRLTDLNGDDVVDESDLTGDQVIEWNRAAYLADGTQRKAMDAVPATKIYKSIGAAGESYSINSYNDTYKTHFTHFVTYVIRNIPTSNYNAYLQVYLSIPFNGISKLITSTVDQKTQFYYDYDQENGCFAIIKNSSGFTTVATNDVDSQSVFSKRLDQSLTSNDSLLLFNKTSNTFKVLGFSSFSGNENELVQVGESDFLKPVSDKNYVIRVDDGFENLYVNEEGTLGNYPCISKDGNTALYGLFPKYNINDSTLIEALKNKQSSADSRGYVEHNGDYYVKKVSREELVLSEIKFDNNVTIQALTEYWFKCEPITWKVINDTEKHYNLAANQHLLMSEYVIDYEVFGHKYSKNDYALNYDQIGVLINANNSCFRAKAFGFDEGCLATVSSSVINAGDYQQYIQVFLPSKDDINAYIGSANPKKSALQPIG